LSRNAKFAVENHPFWQNLWAKAEILSFCDLFCWKFTAVWQNSKFSASIGKLQLSGLPTFFNPLLCCCQENISLM